MEDDFKGVVDMLIKKGETEIKVPNWVAVLGLAAVVDVVSVIANAAVVKKSK